MVAFGDALPHIRKQVERDLSLPGLPREKCWPSVVKLMASTFIRVGNDGVRPAEQFLRPDHSRDHHVEVSGSRLQFNFTARAERACHQVADPRLARIVKRCQDIPGYELFQYLDENGKRRKIDSSDVNEYLRQISGHDFTAKDFRTWAGTVLAAFGAQGNGSVDSARQAKKNIVEAIKIVAEQLGNTPAICRKCYVHPLIIESYSNGWLLEKLEILSTRSRSSSNGLEADEAPVLAFLRGRPGR